MVQGIFCGLRPFFRGSRGLGFQGLEAWGFGFQGLKVWGFGFQGLKPKVERFRAFLNGFRV